MNPVQQVLDRELGALLERIAGSLPSGTLTSVMTSNPALKARLEVADSQLAAARASMLEAYGRWNRALEDLENLWAVAELYASTSDVSLAKPDSYEAAELAPAA
jgi:hypothetical protein